MNDQLNAQWSWIMDVLRTIRLDESEGRYQAYGKILQHAVGGFNATSGTLSLLNDSQDTLTIAASEGYDKSLIEEKIPLNSSLFGKVVRDGKPLLINGDITTDPKHMNALSQRTTPRPKSAICWPLKVDNTTIGVISINRIEGEEYSEADVTAGMALIKLIVMALENVRLHAEQANRIEELSALNNEMQTMNARLEEAHNQLLQQEKLASIGQLAAGVAHEINNPVGYVNSNLTTLEDYFNKLIEMLDAYERVESLLDPVAPEKKDLDFVKQVTDLSFLKEDIFDMIKECQEGVGRVRQIVQDLKQFSHVDSQEWQLDDLHKGLDSTLNIVYNEIKYKANVRKEYGELPPVECLASQLNQVFMNLLVNAAQAIDESGEIVLRTGVSDGHVWVEVEDSGKGISKEHLNRIFDPFFTTKPVGKGTGLGLSLSYGIVKKHRGRIEVRSEIGKGTAFRIWLPVVQEADVSAAV